MANNYKAIVSEINKYLKVKAKLNAFNVVRSQKFNSDYSEWLASKLFKCKMSENRNESGWDICDSKFTYQVKHHSKAITNKNRWSTISNFNFSFLIIMVFTESLKISELYLISRNHLKSFKNSRINWNKLGPYRKQKKDFPKSLHIFFN